MDNQCSQRRRPIQRETLILPLNLPRLTDKVAVQLVEVLHTLVAGIEHHYATQIYRYHQRQRELRLGNYSRSTPDDPPF